MVRWYPLYSVVPTYHCTSDELKLRVSEREFSLTCPTASEEERELCQRMRDLSLKSVSSSS